MNTLPELYQKMADMTRPICMQCPRVSSVTRCCSAEYCEMAEMVAEDKGETLPPRTGHATLPYMSESGCVVPPHLRPACTLHVCSMNSMGVLYSCEEGKPDRRSVDREATDAYFQLREHIETLELEAFLDKHPEHRQACEPAPYNPYE